MSIHIYIECCKDIRAGDRVGLCEEVWAMFENAPHGHSMRKYLQVHWEATGRTLTRCRQAIDVI